MKQKNRETMPTSKIVQEFRLRIEIILAGNLQNVYWFGSTSRTQAHAESDIDLLVETKLPVTVSQRDKIADVAIDLCSETGFVLDVHYYTSKEISTPPYSYSPFIETIIREGVLS